jgi:DNA-binding FadR family transcriptional regulator
MNDAARLRVPKTAELIARRIRRQIVRGELVEGTALPPESVLIEEYGISRPTMREVFRVLEAEQLLSVRRGTRGGARIHSPSPAAAARNAALVLEYEGATLADVYEARVMIETPCAALLARNRTRDDLSQLRASLADGESLRDDRPKLILHHAEFHALVVELAGNVTMRLLSGMLRQIVDAANVRRVDTDPANAVHDRAFDHGVRAHGKLVDLIEARDFDGASALWTKHLVEANRYLLELPNATTVLDLLE